MGGIGGLLLLGATVWLPFHFSGKALLYYRATEPVMLPGYAGTTLVTCKFLNSTGSEEIAKLTAYPEQYYCPRYKDIGQ